MRVIRSNNPLRSGSLNIQILGTGIFVVLGELAVVELVGVMIN